MPEEQTEYTENSRPIHIGPCIVKSVHIAAGGAAYNACWVYDGLNSNGKLKAYLSVVQRGSYTWRPGNGAKFYFGIYIRVVDTDAKVTTTFEPEARKLN